MASAATGRQRYRWLLLLLSAVLLVAWAFVEGTGGTGRPAGADAPGATSGTTSGTSSGAVAGDPSGTASGGPSGSPSSTSADEQTDGGSVGSSGGSSDGTDPDSGLPWIEESALPDQAIEVLARIDAGGPFDYPGNDDVTFENREDLLPEEPYGYYREYTVEVAPRVRGPQRIVTGEGGEYYWTADHYDSFSRIRR